MTYKEFGECYAYALKKASEIDWLNIEVKPYSMWNGAKGFEIQLWNEDGLFLYDSYHTGVWQDPLSMKKAIDKMIDRLVGEAA